jgi:hypothetical protein
MILVPASVWQTLMAWLLEVNSSLIVPEVLVISPTPCLQG